MKHVPRDGNCYEDCLIMFIEGIFNQENSECFLVHGYPRLSVDACGYKEGTKYGHAWIERDTNFSGHVHTECINVCPEVVLPSDLYYHHGRIDPEETTRYSRKQVMYMVATKNHSGPWNNKPVGSVFKNDTKQEVTT